MTRQQLDETFTQHYNYLVRTARKKCPLPDDAMDLVHTVYATACSRNEYTNVPLHHARSWWTFKLREINTEQGKVRRKVRQVEEAFGHEYGQPVEQELSEMDGCEVMEEYWKGLPRYQRTRIRQQWQAEGRALLPFMQVERRRK